MMSDKKWKVLSSAPVFQAGFFRLRVDECALPDGRVMPRYYVVEFADWVHVLPVTRDGQAVLVRQYRHAAQTSFLEVPGGSTDPRTGETTEAAARRELLEETGYAAGAMISLGVHYPNPALQNNRMHSYLALDCECVADPQLDPFEDLHVELVPLRDLYQSLFAGDLQHSLIMSTLILAYPHLRDRTE